MKRKAIAIIFILVFVLALAKIFLTAKLATAGADLAKIESDGQNLTERNQLLEEKVVELSSLSRISQEAAKLGLAKAEKVISLTFQMPVAMKED